MKLTHLQEAGYANTIPSNWSEEKVLKTFFELDNEDEDIRYYWGKGGFSFNDSDGYNFQTLIEQDGKFSAMSDDNDWVVDLSSIRIYESRQVYGKPS